MRTELAVTHVEVQPGQLSRIEIEATNTADVIDGIIAIVDGLDPDWVRFDTPVVTLFPGATSTIGFNLEVPRDCPAGNYLVVVRVVSTIDADRQTVHDLWVSVAPAPALRMVLRPRMVTGGSTARFRARLANIGNTAAPVFVTALDRAREVDCSVVPAEVVVPQGTEALVEVRVKGKRPWFGQRESRTIIVSAVSGDIELEELLTFIQRPRIARGVLTFAILAGIVALWATIFLLVADSLSSGADPGKALAKEFNNGGVANVPLAAIAGNASGRVYAASNGEGVPRLTVQAQRQRADGGSVASGSAATDDEGLFELSSLIPGNYIFRFSGDGFDDVWYPGVIDEADAAIVRIEPVTQTGGIDLVLTGEVGAILGTIAVPESADAAPEFLVVAILLVSPEDLPPGVDPPDQLQFEQRSDGNIRLEGLPTPGTYRITVTGGDFEPRTFEESLEAGEIKVLNTIRLGAASGSISGQVVDGSGQPLGGVDVAVQSGDFEAATVTPTSGNVGEFSVIGLETPATYVLTFSLDGYSGQTVAVDLLAGQTLGGVSATLVGGLGSISGTVLDPRGVALGDVNVVVAGNDFTAGTSTLTTGAVGSYDVSQIPVPGAYTVTFVAEGFVSETLLVEFAAAGTQPGNDVTLRPSVSQVSGIVSGNGTPLGEVAVRLNNGLLVRTTSSATSPLGRFNFAEVQAGTYTLSFEAPGFVSRTVLVRIAEGELVERDVDLVASGNG